MKALDIFNILQKTRFINASEIYVAVKDVFVEQNKNTISESFITLDNILRICFKPSFISRFTGKTVIVSGDEPDFHNLFVELANHGLYFWATLVAEKGLRIYPLSSDLLTDYIGSSSHFTKFAFLLKRRKRIITLMKLPRNHWTWRSYTSYIKFLISKFDMDRTSEIEQQIKTLIKDFRENIPYNENSYYVESRFYDAIGEVHKSRNVLGKAIVESESFPKNCALKLSKIYLDISEYDKAINILLKCKKNLACFEEADEIGNVCFQLLLSRLGKYFFNKDELSEDELEKLYADSREDFRILNKMSFNSNEAQSIYSRLENLATLFSAETGYLL